MRSQTAPCRPTLRNANDVNAAVLLTHEWSLVAGVPRDLPLQRLRLGQEVGEHGVPLVLGHLVVAPEGALVREGAGGQGADGGAVGAVVLRVGQKEAAAVRRDSQNHLLGNAAQREPQLDAVEQVVSDLVEGEVYLKKYSLNKC